MILGGIVAGIVGDILGYLVDGLMLAPQWAAGMKALGRPELSVSQSVAFSIIGLVYGILMVWLYAAIRPRYGPGRQIAVLAGLAIWVSGVLLPNAGLMWAAGLFPTSLTVLTTSAGIVEFAVAGFGRIFGFDGGTWAC